jgi:hypothetical protein
MTTSTSLLKDHSILFQLYHHTDTLIFWEEMLLSRHQMDSRLNLGGSIKNQEQLRTLNTEDGLSTSRMVEDQTISKLITPTQDGSNSLHLKKDTLLMLKTKNVLMLREDKIKKDKLFGSGENIMVPIKDGPWNILTKRNQLQLRELMKISVFIETDHSS